MGVPIEERDAVGAVGAVDTMEAAVRSVPPLSCADGSSDAAAGVGGRESRAGVREAAREGRRGRVHIDGSATALAVEQEPEAAQRAGCDCTGRVKSDKMLLPFDWLHAGGCAADSSRCR